MQELAGSGILNDNVLYKGQVSLDEGIDLLHSADLLVIPLTYDESQLKSYSFSFPTKLAEYLATGSPVLILSSPLASSAIFCNNHNVGHLIDNPSSGDIETYLANLWHNPVLGDDQGFRNKTLCRKL